MFKKVWIYFLVVLTWAVSWWWWLQCWKRIASLCTECRVQQDCTVHRIPKCLKNVQKLCTPVALRSLIEHNVWYREMQCTFCIAIIIINWQLKSKQPGNIFTPLGNLHDFFYFYERKKIPRFWLLFQGKKMFIFSFFFPFFY